MTEARRRSDAPGGGKGGELLPLDMAGGVIDGFDLCDVMRGDGVWLLQRVLWACGNEAEGKGGKWSGVVVKVKIEVGRQGG